MKKNILMAVLILALGTGFIAYIFHSRSIEEDLRDDLALAQAKIGGLQDQVQPEEGPEKEVLLQVQNLKMKAGGKVTKEVELDTSALYDSTEGSVVTLSLYQEERVQIKVNYFGEMGQVEIRFYDLGDLGLFVEEDHVDYPSPFDIDNAKSQLNTYWIQEGSSHSLSQQGLFESLTLETDYQGLYEEIIQLIK